MKKLKRVTVTITAFVVDNNQKERLHTALAKSASKFFVRELRHDIVGHELIAQIPGYTESEAS